MKKHPSLQKRLFRRMESRAVAPRLIIFCDDTKTAPAYFSALKRYLSEKYSTPPIIDVKPAPKCGTTPKQLVEYVKASGAKMPLTNQDDSVWVLSDLEGASKESSYISQLREKQTKHPHLRPVVSKPCFEVWTLHHLEDTGEQFSDCNAVNTKLKAAWKKKFYAALGNKKAQADYVKIVHLHKEAADRSKRHRRSSHCYSEVYLIFDEINAYLAKCGTTTSGQ